MGSIRFQPVGLSYRFEFVEQMGMIYSISINEVEQTSKRI